MSNRQTSECTRKGHVGVMRGAVLGLSEGGQRKRCQGFAAPQFECNCNCKAVNHQPLKMLTHSVCSSSNSSNKRATRARTTTTSKHAIVGYAQFLVTLQLAAMSCPHKFLKVLTMHTFTTTYIHLQTYAYTHTYVAVHLLLL